MAKTLTDEDIKLNIIINGNDGQKELFDLEKSTRKLTEENKGLLLQKKLLEKQGKKDTEQYRLLNSVIKDNSKSIAQNKNRMEELQKQIGITGLTMKQLTERANILQMSLRNAVPGGENFQRYNAELTQVRARINELRGHAQQAGVSIGSIADKFNRYQSLAVTAIAGLTGIVLSIQKIIDINGKLSDAQADVMKTTRMTKEEVDDLTKSFGLLKTRTQRIDLLNIAAVGGELNIAKNEIFDFVKVMDKAAVSLGDSFEGGPEEVATKLGKIKTLYDELKEANVELAFESVGSALNDLGADGNATASNVAEFVQRVGNIPAGLRPSIATALGLGAAFEESGLNAEIAGNNYGKLLRIAARDFPQFAKVMKISADEAKNLINTDPTAFFLKFTESLKGLSNDQIANVLDKLKLNDNEVQMVIAAASKNTDLFRQKIDLANKSMDAGTSLTEEFNVKNTNLQATLEKVSKKISGWFSSESFNNWLFTMVNGFAKLIGATDDADGSSQKWRNTLVFTAKVIAIVTSALITNLGWQKLVALWTTRNTEATLLYTIASKARAVADGIAVISTQALAMVQMLLVGNLRGATQAFRVMTATMMTTPWGFILGAIAAIGAAYILFSENAKEAATAQSMIADTTTKVNDLVAKESQTFLSLMSVINDTTASTEARSAALIKAKEIGGEYTEGLTLENAATFEGKTMIDNYIKSLERKMTLQVLESKQKSILEQIQERKNKGLEEEVGMLDEIWSYAKNFGNTTLASGDVVVTAALRRKKGLEDLQNQLKFTNAEMAEFLKANPDVITKIDTGETADPNALGQGSGTEKKNPNSTQEELNRLRLESESRYNDALIRNRRQLEDDKIAAMQDGYDKEMALENLRYAREIEDLDRQKVHADEIAKMDEDIAKAKEAKDITKYNALLAIRKGWDDKNAQLDEQINKIKEGKLELHYLKIATIQEKNAAEEFKKQQENYEREKLIRETKFNEEYASLGSNEVAKAKLKRDYEENELRAQQEFLEKLLKETQDILRGNNGKVDMSLLSPEQKDAFVKQIEELENKISSLKGSIAALKGGTSSGTDFNILQGTGTDILGYTPEQWQQVFTNFDTTADKIKAVETVIGGLQNAFSMYSSFMEANQQREIKTLDRNYSIKKRKLKQDLDNGLINKLQYEKAIKKLDEDKEKKMAEMEYKKAKRDRIMSLFNIAVNTGVGIMKAVAASPLTGGMPWTAIIAGMGAIQAATVLATPLPAKGYEKGLYPIEREQDGKMFNAGYGGRTRSGMVNKPTFFLTGENGPEMIIDSRAYSQISPATKNALLRELRGIKGFENGYYNQDKMRIETPAGSTPSSGNANDDMTAMNMAVMAETLQVLKDLRDNPILAVMSDRDYPTLKKMYEGLDKYSKTMNNTKK